MPGPRDAAGTRGTPEPCVEPRRNAAAALPHSPAARIDLGAALRIPHALAADADLRAGSSVEPRLRDGKIVVEPAQRLRYALEELLAGIRKSNLHGEIAAGKPVGREAW